MYKYSLKLWGRWLDDPTTPAELKICNEVQAVFKIIDSFFNKQKVYKVIFWT